MYSTHNEGRSAIAERFIRTLKNKIYKDMISISKNVYIDKLDDTVNKYNNTYHSTIKMPKPATLLKKRLCHRCFPVNFEKFLRTPFFTEHLRWLLLTNASLNSKINEVKDEIPNITNLATTTALTAVENKIPNVSNFVEKLIITQKFVKLKIKLLLIMIMINILLLKNLIS